MTFDSDLATESFCYLTTVGRVSGRPHTIEIWFALHDGRLYMLAGGGDKSDWVRNLRRRPRVSVRIREQTFEGDAGVVSDPDEDALARRLLLDKYTRGYGGDLSSWGRTALPVVVRLAESKTTD